MVSLLGTRSYGGNVLEAVSQEGLGKGAGQLQCLLCILLTVDVGQSSLLEGGEGEGRGGGVVIH